MHHLESDLKNETHKFLLDFDIQTDHQTTRPNNRQKKKKRTYRIVDFTVLTENRIKLKESKKDDTYLDLAR